ncbi:hypothetical protein CF335_g7462 [Tilletia laevis]|nr:hypothetical protein CF335_g7462 [Tilletia laevis]
MAKPLRASVLVPDPSDTTRLALSPDSKSSRVQQQPRRPRSGGQPAQRAPKRARAADGPDVADTAADVVSESPEDADDDVPIGLPLNSWVAPPEWRACGRYRRSNKAEVLGEGAYARVVRVVDTFGGPDRARKRQEYDDDGPSKQLLFEVRTLLRLQKCKGFVELIDICHRRGKIDIIMPIYWGSLDDLIGQELGGLQHETARNLSMQLLLAVGAMHRLGLAHLDIKPGNILLNAAGTLHISDFGKAAEVGTTAEAGTVGTVGYSAPECLIGMAQATFQSDVWSTGCVVAEIYRGRSLFSAEDGLDSMKEILRFTGHHGGRIFSRNSFTKNTTLLPTTYSPFRADGRERLMDLPVHAVSLIIVMLRLEPMQRPHVATLFQHSLFTEVIMPDRMPSTSR